MRCGAGAQEKACSSAALVTNLLSAGTERYSVRDGCHLTASPCYAKMELCFRARHRGSVTGFQIHPVTRSVRTDQSGSTVSSFLLEDEK